VSFASDIQSPLHFLHKITTRVHSADTDLHSNDTVADCQASVTSPHIFSSNLIQQTGFLFIHVTAHRKNLFLITDQI